MGLSWRQLADMFETSSSNFTRLKQGSVPQADLFLTYTHWLGVPAATFVYPTPKVKQPPLLVEVALLLYDRDDFMSEQSSRIVDILAAALGLPS